MDKLITDKTIFIVEDDQFLADLLCKKFQAEKALVLHYSSGENLLSDLDGKTPALIIIDVLLPGLNGIETLKKIREQKNLIDTPVVLLSNLESENYSETLKDLGKTSFIVKSNYNLDELIIEIKKFLKK